MRPISTEKRNLLIEAKKRGESEENISIWLNICKRSIGRIWTTYTKTNSIQPIPYAGRKSRMTSEQEDTIKAAIKETPDITLEELIEKLNLTVKKSRLSTWLIQNGYSYKKRLFIQKNSSEKMFNKSEQSGERNSKN